MDSFKFDGNLIFLVLNAPYIRWNLVHLLIKNDLIT